MILRLLEFPLVDVLLLVLLLRLFFPSLFGVRSRAKQKARQEQTTVHNSSTNHQQKFKKEEGEYIEYEEIK